VKRVLVIYEGAAGEASDELEGTTPLALARSIHASALAARGVTGALFWGPETEADRTEAALAVLLGADPAAVKNLRRGPVEAAAVAGHATGWTYAYRGNLVATDGVEVRESRVGGLSLDETKWLGEALAAPLREAGAQVLVSDAGRLVVTLDRLTGAVDPGPFPEVGSLLEPPHQRKPTDRQRLMARAAEVLATASLNDVRVDLGENPANGLWLWSGGPPVMVTKPWPNSVERPVLVTNSPLARGLAALWNTPVLPLGDVWAETGTPELIDAEELFQALLRHDLVVIYVEAPYEGGRFGGGVEQVKALDRLDIHLLGRVVEVVKRLGDQHRIMLAALPPAGVWMEHTPVVVAGDGIAPDPVTRWEEAGCMDGALGRVSARRCLAQIAGD
jgi:2,3-bisphosphoglycerate-independent phosphoglycerate mutase